MIEDGYWIKELENELKEFKKKRRKRKYYSQELEHQINKSLLLSAVIMRKMFEDEKNCETALKDSVMPLPPLKLLKYKVKLIEYPIGVEEPFLIERYIPDNYDYNNQKVVEVKLNDLCNQIIHSFVWQVVFTKQQQELYGVLFASDKVKENKSYLLSNDEWIKVLEYCIENNTLKQRR